jgi:tryptophanyl-tRNA synthetase
LRQAVGLRSLHTSATATTSKAAKVAVASFKQYREKDGRFYFKLVDAQGNLLLQSLGFESPKVAGQSIAQLQQQGGAALLAMAHLLEPQSADHQTAIATALAEMTQDKV